MTAPKLTAALRQIRVRPADGSPGWLMAPSVFALAPEARAREVRHRGALVADGVTVRIMDTLSPASGTTAATEEP